MRRVLYLLLIATFGCNLAATAQRYDYDKQWKRVEERAQKGLPKSALALADSIYAQAVKEGAPAQSIKALLNEISLREQVDDSSEIHNLERIATRTKVASGVEKALLQSIYADLLSKYLMGHYYQWTSRTDVAGDTSTDMSTWSAARFNKEVDHYYKASIAPMQLLYATKMTAYKPLIIAGSAPASLRPTMYDFLAHRALDYFKRSGFMYTQTAAAFQTTDPLVFAPVAVFTEHTFATRDTASLHYQALLLWQQLGRLHIADGNKDALLDLDKERLQFMVGVSLLAQKDSLYMAALQNLKKDYAKQPEVTGVYFLEASKLWSEREQRAKDSTGNRRAKALCDSAIKINENSFGGRDCQALLREITGRTLNLRSEIVNLPGQPFRALVSYRNISGIYLKLVRLEGKNRQTNEEQIDSSYWAHMLQLKPVKQWEQTLIDPVDYADHSTEIKVDALPAGQYILFASVSPDFKLTGNPMVLQEFAVSEVSYLQYRDQYLVVHRETGKPLEGITVKRFGYTNGESSNGRTSTLLATGITDKIGRVKCPVKQNQTVKSTVWIMKNDTLQLEEGYSYNYQYNSSDDDDFEAGNETQSVKTFLFTDRAIYRPGQTVHFKGIVVAKNKKTKKMSPATKFSTVIFLHDESNEEIDSVTVKTNDYGAYWGTLQLPASVRPGSFSLEDDSTGESVSFSVEEYKRPTFEITFDTLRAAYRLWDTVSVGVNATAYSGANIDGAEVEYEVTRTAQYPYPWLAWGKGYVSTGSQTEMISGDTTTDASGRFTVRFPATPNRSLDSTLLPVFNYNINVKVTDLNGETHEENKLVMVGYQSLVINATLPATLEREDLDNIKVTTESLNGDKISTPVTATLTALKAPAKLIRTRYWDMPDKFVIPEDEYHRTFPLDVYKNENDKHAWTHGQEVWMQTFVPNANDDIILSVPGNVHAGTHDTALLASGTYELVLTAKDDHQHTVQQKFIFDYVSKNDPAIPAGLYKAVTGENKAYAPNEQVKVNFGVGPDTVYLLKTTVRKDGADTTTVSQLHNGWQEINTPVYETQGGGFLIDLSFVKDNRFYNVKYVPTVPFSDKQLKLELQSYRNKMLPGEKQQWKLHVSGYKADKVAAELLVGMYDASLDAFAAHQWTTPALYPYFYSTFNWSARTNMEDKSAVVRDIQKYKTDGRIALSYDELYRAPEFYSRSDFGSGFLVRGMATMKQASLTGSVASVMAAPAPMAEDAKALKEAVPAATGKQKENQPLIRKDFRETAFFFPDLQTDKDGGITFSFTMPEAQTRWKFMALAHTKELAFGYISKTVVTQQQLMVQANAPRFLRTRDRIELSAKVSNLTDSTLKGNVNLELLDAATGNTINARFANAKLLQSFTVAAKQSTVVRFPLQVPADFNSALQYRLVATSGALGDGEENAIPVLTNTTLVTETLPLPVNGDGTQTFTLPNLLHSDTAKTLQQHSLQLEFTSNPVWYAVQSLPYLMEYPYECAEQTFNRYYANTLAGYIVAQLPQIRAVFDKWKMEDTSALLSNLQKNESLKSALLAETPWVLEAKGEAAQHKQVADLFDLYKLGVSKLNAKEKLEDMQLSSGAFPWFRGMYEDRFITQYIVAGIGRLQRLDISGTNDQELNGIASRGIAYLDQQIKKNYLELLRDKADTSKTSIGSLEAHYLYMRSFFPKVVFADSSKKAWAFYKRRAARTWVQQSSYTQSLIALALYRNGETKTANKIIASLKENTIENPELGIYWKDQQRGYYWQESPVESQAQMLETFDEITKDAHISNGIKTWLLKNKQVHSWSTTKATADACYALLLHGSETLTHAPVINIQVGNEKIAPGKTEAGTGYFTHQWKPEEIKPSMGNVTITAANTQGLPAWGALYWQYFQDMDAVKDAQTSLQLQKQLFITRNTDKGPVLEAITDKNQLKTGDKVTVRIIMKTDRDLEYVHLKDLRAACFEPVDVISGYQWQSDMSYYKAIKDVSMNFFFGTLSKGTHVLEYKLYVTHKGDFSNGISTLQCMYAPEFSAHSEGLRVKVVE